MLTYWQLYVQVDGSHAPEWHQREVHGQSASVSCHTWVHSQTIACNPMHFILTCGQVNMQVDEAHSPERHHRQNSLAVHMRQLSHQVHSQMIAHSAIAPHVDLLATEHAGEWGT